MPSGYIYVLLNSTIPGLVKVGKTTGLAEDRANALSSATGVAAPFDIVKSYSVMDCDAAERHAHRVLEAVVGRPNARREFFNGPAETVCSVLDDALFSYTFGFEDADIDRRYKLAIAHTTRKEHTLACLEFEAELTKDGSLPTDYIISSQRKRVLGIYLASCTEINRTPVHLNCILDPRIKGEVLTKALETMKVWSTDPTEKLLLFVRTLTQNSR